MLKALYKNVNWGTIRWVGFDVDGTVYDEAEFISQVYLEIVAKLLGGSTAAYGYMLHRWLEKGSSYTRIFDETHDLFGTDQHKSLFIDNALSIFRNFNPRITLNKRSQIVIAHLAKHFQTFAITDGNPVLQRKKVKSLALEDYISPENTIYSGDYKLSKPDEALLEYLPGGINPEEAIFFGDRDKDADFAKVLGCNFVRVYNMIENEFA